MTRTFIHNDGARALYGLGSVIQYAKSVGGWPILSSAFVKISINPKSRVHVASNEVNIVLFA